jgi:UDP-glucose:(heptosyl)LPS alpha-1,3-glucosyltransferase
MKIALIAEWLDPWRGGAEASTQQFLYELIRRGVEVHVFTRSRPAAVPGMEVRTISGAAMSRTRRSVTFAHRVERLLQAESFDVVHAISPFRSADIYQPRGGTVAETIERNLALITHGTVRAIKRAANHLNLKQRYLLAMERRMFRDPDGPMVVAISGYVRRQLKNHYGLCDERIRLVYNAVDLDTTPPEQRSANRMEIRREFRIDPSHTLVLLVAHNFKLKGVASWLAAMAHLNRHGETDLRALIVGKGDSPRWHRMAGKLGVAPFVVFTGASNRVTMFRHACDVVVHPTYYDPCSRVVLEAMSSAIACVATRWDGSSELIEHGRNGFVVDDPSDAGEIAKCVEQLRDSQTRSHVGAAAAEAADYVSMKRHVEDMLTVYREITGTRRRQFAAVPGIST